MRMIKVFKGVFFIVAGMILFGVKFYSIVPSVYITEADLTVTFLNPHYVIMYFDQFFKQTGINVILAIMFIGIGILELLEIKGVVKNGN